MHLWSVRPLIAQALREDIGTGDVTTEAILPPGTPLVGRLVVKQAGRIAGLPVAEEVFRLLDPQVRMERHVDEGSDVAAGTVLATVSGEGRAILSAERVALNLLQRLSGIATATRDVCRAVADFPVRIADTRKTLPGLRALDKYAVRMGGGINHRFGLYDCVLIKDNHIAAAGSLSRAVEAVRRHVGHWIKVEVEADTLEQVDEAVRLGVDLILFDNMPPDEVAAAVRRVGGRAITEASGGITPENVRVYAATGVDVLSLGWLTHSVRALDISLDVQPGR
ncbi:MAG: carboxylating nicotinate-nucleotide diphosphorylase [Calditerricola sp.]|jgi:nicotinate-nucleotide pyrophosphorylase|nr:nicotinate-nucleotide diphosphorylase (carboxylating) [Bacillota bacterium]MCG0313246.1 carboxylating nicotinate-nucleotide diphosphorylase [Calditerricola sp.]